MHKLMFLIPCAAAFVACASAPAVDPKAQVAAFCAVATPELSAFDAVKAQLSEKSRQVLAAVEPVAQTVCAPNAVASAVSAQALVTTLLPALTEVGFEYAGLKHGQ